MAWTSPLSLRLLGKEGSYYPLSRPLTDTELSWASSLMNVGAMLGSLLVGFTIDRFGRKRTLLALGGIPSAVGWLVTIFARNAPTLYVARFLIGISTGVSSLIAPTYISEFSSPSLRGSLGSILQIMLNLGLMVPYCIGPYASYQVLAGVSLVFPILFLITFFFLPETAYHLLAKRRPEEAVASMAWFRGQEVSEGMKNRLHQMSVEIQESSSQGILESFKDLFSNRGNRLALLVVTGVMITLQYCGINVVLYNQESIFRGSAKTDKPLLSPSESEMVTGAVQNVSSWITVGVVDRIGRRPLLLVSAGLTSLALLALGVQSYLEINGDPAAANLSWIPVTSLMIYVAAFCLGLGPLTWVILSELFTTGAKSSAALIEGTLSWFLAFVVTRTYLPMKDSMNPYGVYWFYSVCAALGFVFIAKMLPETKCKTLEDVHKELLR
ncbi:facilitated trehalose transporter Tret1-like [Hetaerina americana]|uniref:facilitated trehalose transporter Tret1-like n=1 Tax=Hetaerina americana TaxID=62018 RepID=UPI003A7F61C6